MRARWMLALLLSAGGCFQDDASTQTPCRPTCREGFTCVFGTCVSLCNPPCGQGSRCVPLDTDRGVCAPDGTDAGAAPTDLGAVDAGVLADRAVDEVPVQPADVVAPDALGPGDVPLPEDLPRDAVMEDRALAPDSGPIVSTDRPEMDAVDASAVDARAVDAPDVVDRPAADVVYRDVQFPDAGPCGRPSEPCCAEVGCFPGALCVRGRCEPYALDPTECLSTRDCPANSACAGLVSCGTNPNWRWCNRCQVVPGTARFGDTCRTYTDCATGVCSFGRCTHACDLSGTGDAQCAGFGVRSGTCTQITYGLPPIADGGIPRAVQLQGVCEIGCARNRDCASGTACIPLSDDLLDRVVFICATTRATAQAGTPCRFGDDCQSGMCIGGANPMGGAACSAPCLEDSDCPTAAPVCTSLRLYTSRGTAVATRGCLPRR